MCFQRKNNDLGVTYLNIFSKENKRSIIFQTRIANQLQKQQMMVLTKKKNIGEDTSFNFFATKHSNDNNKDEKRRNNC